MLDSFFFPVNGKSKAYNKLWRPRPRLLGQGLQLPPLRRAWPSLQDPDVELDLLWQFFCGAGCQRRMISKKALPPRAARPAPLAGGAQNHRHRSYKRMVAPIPGTYPARLDASGLSEAELRGRAGRWRLCGGRLSGRGGPDWPRGEGPCRVPYC